MHEDEPAETFNQDQQEMFQNPDTNLGETRPRTPGTQNAAEPPAATNDDEAQSESEESTAKIVRRAE